ncbi:hypothetical protein ACFL2H_10550 [Planctomycetota bacterium]
MQVGGTHEMIPQSFASVAYSQIDLEAVVGTDEDPATDSDVFARLTIGDAVASISILGGVHATDGNVTATADGEAQGFSSHDRTTTDVHHLAGAYHEGEAELSFITPGLPMPEPVYALFEGRGDGESFGSYTVPGGSTNNTFSGTIEFAIFGDHWGAGTLTGQLGNCVFTLTFDQTLNKWELSGLNEESDEWEFVVDPGEDPYDIYDLIEAGPITSPFSFEVGVTAVLGPTQDFAARAKCDEWLLYLSVTTDDEPAYDLDDFEAKTETSYGEVRVDFSVSDN